MRYKKKASLTQNYEYPVITPRCIPTSIWGGLFSIYLSRRNRKVGSMVNPEEIMNS